MQILNDLLYRTENGFRGNLQEHQMKVLFGLRPEQKWPDEGTGYEKIGNVWVYVASKKAAKMRGQFHRMRAQCPYCQKEMSAGRLHQHLGFSSIGKGKKAKSCR